MTEILALVSTGENDFVRTWKLSKADKSYRQSLITHQKDMIDRRIAAAIEIQRVWRGYYVRRRLVDLNPSPSHMADNSLYPQEINNAHNVQGKVVRQAISQLKSRYERVQHCDILFEDFSAIIIQEWWKNLHMDPEDQQKRRNMIEAYILYEHQNRIKERAACIIQKKWRTHIDTKVFEYYKNLINFSSQDNPALLLRCINPVEASMIDAAAGIHVRFRLSGLSFPPIIYYKIFTHKPVVDICAYSPKDYTRESVKRPIARQVNTRTASVTKDPDKSNWYKRFENNGWRSASDQIIHSCMQDALIWESHKCEFHYSKLQREKDMSKKKKLKKIQWMQKMYRQGLLNSKVEEAETQQLVNNAVTGLMTTVEHSGCNAIEDWEVDELLKWTTGLNFEDYLKGWKELATTCGSQRGVADVD